jgi:oxalate decarboxylase/phosphoglucose isomerase-like protein (cupin superfamily)
MKAIASLVALVCLLIAQIDGQAPAAPRQPRGTATDVTNAELQATAQKMTAAVADVQLKVVAIDNQPNIGIGVVRRTRPGGANSIEHSQVTEVYHMIEGTATLVTGGTMENPQEAAADSQVVKVLNGPSTSGGKITGGTSRKLSVGDVVIIPPNTPHWFSDISSDQIVYLVVRVDPHKVLPAGYGTK